MENKIRIFEEFLGYEIYTLDKVLQELKQIAKKQSKKSIAARLALKIIEKNEIKVLHAPKSADEKLIELTKKGYVIATNDSELVKEIKRLGGRIAQIKQRKYVEIS